MSTNNIYYVDMEKRFNDYKEGKIDLYSNHHMVYEINNVALALRQLSQSSGKMALGQDKTNYKTLEKYSISELSEIVKDRLLKKKMNYVRRTYIPKNNGKKRPLGICSIWDKLVEKCIQLVLDPYCETEFVESSFGFREQISAHNALAKVKNQCQTMSYVLSLDLENYFGTIDSDIAYREIWHIGIRDQGDHWHDKSVGKFHHYGHKRRNMEKTNLKIGIHVRFADDILILCKDIEDAKKFKYSITKYLTKNMKLTINEDKTKIYDLHKEKMKYLGYIFYVEKQNCKNVKKKGKRLVSNTLPKSKEDEIVEKCRVLLKNIENNTCLETVHAWNVYVIGLHNYYKGMTHFYKSFRKISWRIYKRFYHTMSKKIKFITEQSHKNTFMSGAYRTWGVKGYYCLGRYPVIEIGWANWDSTLIAAVRSKPRRTNPYDYGNKKHKPGVSLKDISYLVNTSNYIKNSRLAMFRVSKYSCSKGKSFISGEYVPVEEYHCHHITPRYKGGISDFDNLCVLSKEEHTILHSATPERLYAHYPKKIKQINKLINSL